MTQRIETVIVGGGQAGLAMSYYLREHGQEHIILERRRLAERWRTERWDGLYFQFPNWSLQLPGCSYDGEEPDAFAKSSQVVEFIERYAKQIKAPLQFGVEVRSLRRDQDSGRFILETSDQRVEAARVVIATGPFQKPSIPAQSHLLSADVLQIHASHYFNPERLPPGAVLIVGTGSSGCQIAEELLQSGRMVYVSVSLHKRAPRRYRNKDLLYWLTVLGRFDTPIDALPGRKIPSPLLLTGAGGGHDVDLRKLVGEGVVLLGRLREISDGKVFFDDDVEKSLAHADDSFVEFVRAAEDYASATGLDSEFDVESDLAFPRSPRPLSSQPVLDLKAANVSAIVWCTGYRFDFNWVELPIFDANGIPVQRRGVTRCRGAYFLGLHWMHNMKSGVLFGVGEDAAYLLEHIASASAHLHHNT
jgi:putative flavoprotein involved in K+ transport